MSNEPKNPNRTAALRRAPAAHLSSAGMLLLNASSIALLTNGKADDAHWVALTRRKDGGVDVYPVQVPEGTVTVVARAEGRRISARLVIAGLAQGQKLAGVWDDVAECMRFSPVVEEQVNG